MVCSFGGRSIRKQLELDKTLETEFDNLGEALAIGHPMVDR
ncbi:MAG: hypothetical protein VW239_00015 [Candidatus Nanopelagicales bacterium]